MVISFQNRTIRQVCEDDESAMEYLDIEIIKILKNRLSDFEAAKNISEIPIGNLKEVNNSKNNFFTIDLIKEYKLIFVVNNLNLQESVKLDWTKITRIKIIDIYNEQDSSVFT